MELNYVELTGEIVGAYIGNHSMPARELPQLIEAVYAGLMAIGSPAEPVPEAPTPPVPIRKTITPDYIISLEDGRPYKSLRRHLTVRGMTPEQYRQKWGLKPDYPMTAANYAAQRSELAKAAGLGRKKETAEPAPPPKRTRKSTKAEPA